MELPTPFAVGTVFAYLIVADPLTLIDTGVGYPEAQEALEAGLASAGFRPAELRRIIVTHCHSDHVGNAGWLQDRSGAEVWIHPDEGAKLAGGDQNREMRRRHLTLAGMPEDEQRSVERLYERARRLITPAPAWQPMVDGQRFGFETGEWLEAMALPGHALGHTGLLLDSRLFGGDHLLLGVTPNPVMEPVPPVHPASVSHAPGRTLTLGQFLDSLTRVSALDLKQVWPGHGAVITDHRRVAAGYVAAHERRLDLMHDRLGAGKSAWELAREFYPRVREFDLFLSLSEVLAHLDLLVVRRRAVVEGERFRPLNPEAGPRATL